MTLLERVYAYNRLLASRRTEAERAVSALLDQVALRERELSAVRSRLAALRAVEHWAELETGDAVAAGTVVRWLGGYYRCLAAHQKSLIRMPSNAEFWESVAEDAALASRGEES